MYICLECGARFSIPTHYREYRGEHFGYPAYEEFKACPACGGDSAETYKCDCCDEWIDGQYIKTDDGKRYCFNCYCSYELGEED